MLENEEGERERKVIYSEHLENAKRHSARFLTLVILFKFFYVCLKGKGVIYTILQMEKQRLRACK